MPTRTVTLDTGKREVELPVDALGRERWRAKLDTSAVERHDGDTLATFRGHAAVFNKRTWIGPKRLGFWEQVAPRAFDKALSESDVRFLINHDPNLLLARNREAQTLRLGKDSTGLVTDADLDTRQTYTSDLVISLERRDITQMSFAFETRDDSWETLGDGTELRTLDEVRLFDVSVVTYPAYEDTDAGLRGLGFDVLCRSLGYDAARRTDLLRKIADGEDIAIDRPEPGSSTRAAESQPGSSTGSTHHLALQQRRLRLLALAT